MELTITARHFKSTPALRDYITEKLRKVEKIYKNIISAHVIISQERYRFSVEIILSADEHKIVVKEETNDLHEAVDMAIDRLHKRILHMIDKLKSHRDRGRWEKI